MSSGRGLRYWLLARRFGPIVLAVVIATLVIVAWVDEGVAAGRFPLMRVGRVLAKARR
jgi:hypothetical protein